MAENNNTDPDSLYLHQVPDKCKNILVDMTETLLKQPWAALFIIHFETPVRWQADEKDQAQISVQKKAQVEHALSHYHLTYMNQALARIYRTTPERLKNRSSSFIMDELSANKQQFMYDLFEQKQMRYETSFLMPDQEQIFLAGYYTCLYDTENNIKGFAGIQLDFSHIREAEKKAHEASQLYQLLADYSTDAVWIYNLRKRRFIFISPAVRSILGYTVDEARALQAQQLVSSEDYQRVSTEISRQLKAYAASRSTLEREKKLNETDHAGFDDAKSNPNLELRIKSKTGDMIWCELNGRFRQNEQNEIELIGSVRDIDKRKKNEERIAYLSFHDQLTTLYNRHFYVAELRRLDVERNLPISLIVSDINGLKATNDIFGHHAGDRLLVKFADVLRDTCRADDIVARIGGDEFIVLLPQTNRRQCEQVLERVRQQMELIKLEQSVLSASFGSVTKEKENQRFSDLFNVAEDEMYKQKVTDRYLFEQRLFEHIENTFYQLNKKEQKHGRRVSAICRQLAEASGFEPDRINLVEKAGYYHDIGKITLNRALLDKEDKLTEEEIYQIRKHAETGYNVLRSLKTYKDIADIVLSHHERPDGCGYPRKLSGDSIMIEASLLSVADAYDTMLNIKKMKKDQVIRELERHAGTQFDAVAVNQMLELIDLK